MNKNALILAIGIPALLLFVAILVGGTLLSHRNTAVGLQEKVNAQYTSNKSNYDNMWKSFVETSQVTDKQAEQFKSVYNEMISGRYKNDSQVLMKMIQEQNPQLDASVYKNLQNLIVSGRQDFDHQQSELTDVIREYNTYIRQHFIMNTIFNFKTLDASNFIVTSQRTTNAFSTGQDNAIDLNSGSNTNSNTNTNTSTKTSK